MLKIGMMHINAVNLGDLIIYKTSEYLLKKALKELGIKEYNLIPVDIALSNAKDTIKFGKNLLKKAELKAQIAQKNSMSEADEEQQYIESWHHSEPYLYFQKYEEEKIKNMDLIFFCGGGLIKYKQQNFHYILHEVTKIAEKENIPVIISSAGVEGFDESAECRILKKAINRSCVKYISTRDDFRTLKEKYIDNPDIVIESVCDPALWAKDVYHIEDHQPSDRIGIGIIRPELFREYMYYVNSDYLKDMYFALVKKLCEAGYEVEFFCNGFDADARFIRETFKQYPSLNMRYNVTMSVPRTPSALVTTIASYDRYTACRLHASIIGYSLGVPNLNLVWNTKQQFFGKQTGMQQNYLTRESFDEDILYEKLLALEYFSVDKEYKNTVRRGIKKSLETALKEQ